MTTALFFVAFIIVSFVVFMNGVLFSSVCGNMDEDEDVPPFYERWIKTINEDQDTQSGKIFMACFYFIISGFAIGSYLGSLIRAKKKKEK